MSIVLFMIYHAHLPVGPGSTHPHSTGRGSSPLKPPINIRGGENVLLVSFRGKIDEMSRKKTCDVPEHVFEDNPAVLMLRIRPECFVHSTTKYKL